MFGRDRKRARAAGFGIATAPPGFIFVGGQAWEAPAETPDDQGVPGAWLTQREADRRRGGRHRASS